jgi:diguanylate cyclase (GGDEF)-like protein
MDQEEFREAPIYLGEFREEALEKAFYLAEISRNLKIVRLALLVAAVLAILLVVPAYYLIRDSHNFMSAAIINCAISAALFFLVFRLTRIKNGGFLSYWFTAYEIIIGLALLYLICGLMTVAFMFQVISLIVMILLVFLINNRWLLSIFTSLLLCFSYFLFAVMIFKTASPADNLAAAFFVLLIIFISSMASYRTNYYKRFHYLKLLELSRMAECDALTGIYNKAKFNKDYVGLTDRARRQQGHLSIVMFDIDNFKEINDEHGHLAGDAVLVELANFILKHIRSTDIFVRWGGDKFILTFPDTHLQLAAEIAEKLRVLIGEHTFETIGHMSCSFGVAAFREGDELDSLVRRADECLYMAKLLGKNQVVGD